MAFPFLHAVGPVLSGAAGITYAWPAGHQTNDIGFLVIESDGVATAAAATGFAHVTGSPLVDVASVAGSKFQVLWMRATSAAMPSVAVADLGDHQIGCIAVYRSCVTTGNPWEALASGVKTTASTTVTLPTVTTLGIDRLIAFFASQPADSNSATEFGVPVNAALTSLTEDREDAINVGNGGGYQISSGRKSAAGATGTTAITLATAATNVFFTLALIPSNPNGGVAPMTGVGSATGTGTIVGRGSASGVLTGTASATGTGTITATGGTGSGSASANLTGSASATQTGVMAGSGGAVATLSGSSSAAAAGAITSTGAASGSLTGTASSAPSGTLAGSGAATAELPGTASAVGAGAPTGQGEAKGLLSGTASSVTAGVLTASGAANQTLTGNASATDTGTMTANGGSASASAFLTGTGSVTQTGAISGSGAATASISGTQGAAAAGIIIGSGGASAMLAGSQSVVSTGVILADGGPYIISAERARLLHRLALLHGLDPANPLSVPTGNGVRSAGLLMQTVSGAGSGTITIATTAAPAFSGSLDAWIDLLAEVHGLSTPLVVTDTTRSAGAWSQTIVTTAGLTTVTRQ